MTLTDICTLEEWKAFETRIHEQFGIDVNVFNTDGIRITDHKAWVNRLCPAIKANPKGQAFICAVAHMNIASEARQTRNPVIEECDAGLIKLVVPIFVKDEFIGAIGACGLLLEDGEVDAFLIEKITDMPESEIEDLSTGIEPISREQAHALIEAVVEDIGNLSGQMVTCRFG
ncbi:MAG: PocR ligand-binding domain-containing protein [Desulfatirhabdiaceae bacterium]